MNRSARARNANEGQREGSAFAEAESLAGDPGGNRTPRPARTGSEPRRLRAFVLKIVGIDRFDVWRTGDDMRTSSRQSVFTGTSFVRSFDPPQQRRSRRGPHSFAHRVPCPARPSGVEVRRPQSGQFPGATPPRASRAVHDPGVDS